jgi:hypothetical protein
MNDIYPSSYGRTDGLVSAFKLKTGWVLRSIRGPAWFWNCVSRSWDISCVTGFRADAPQYVMSEAEALELLPSLAPVV